MDKFVGKWEMLPDQSDDLNDPPRKDNIYTIRQVQNDMMLIHSEWHTVDNKSGFRGYTIHPDGIPRKAMGGDWQFVTKVRGQNVMTTSRLEDDQVRSMEIREVLDSGELKVTNIHVDHAGEQQKTVVYYRKVDSTG